MVSGESSRLVFYLTPFIPSSQSGQTPTRLGGEGFILKVYPEGDRGGEVYTEKNYTKKKFVAAAFPQDPWDKLRLNDITD